MHKSVYTIPNKYIACDKRSFGLRLEIAYQNIANFAVTLKFEGEKYIMSNTINNSRDLLPSNKPEVSMDGTTKELQHNPIFKIWLAISRVRLAPKAIATFFKKEQANSQVESQQDFHATIDSTNSTQEQYYYTRFTDRVDPSLYYTIFVSKKL